jgi:hypothetical protein
MPESDIQHYNVAARTLEQPISYKVRKLLDLGCIKKINQDEYICLPILGYNSTTYRLTRRADGSFQCQCQGFKKYNACAHRQALYSAFEIDERQGTLF